MLVALILALVATQDTVPARLDLGQAYGEARAHNPRISAARALAGAATARVPQASLPPDPQLQLGYMNYSLPSLAPMDAIGMTQLQLMQMIPTAGKLRLSGRIAAAQAGAASERARDAEWEVRSQVAMTFYDLYVTDRSLEVDRQALRLLQDVRAIAEAMYRVGEGRQTDVLRAQVELARMAEDTVSMTTMRTAMAARLNALLDRAADAAVASPRLPAFPDSVLPLDAALGVADRGRPMLRAGEHDVDAAAADVTRARRELWPDLTVGLQYGQRGSSMATERMGSVMLTASVPVFAARRQLRMRDETRAMQQMAVADLTAMRAQTRADVTSAWARLDRARRLASLYQTTILPQAEATVAAALSAYRAGSVDFMTLLDDRMALNTYQRDLFALQADEGRAWAELEMLLGRELFDPNTTSRVARREENDND